MAADPESQSSSVDSQEDTDFVNDDYEYHQDMIANVPLPDTYHDNVDIGWDDYEYDDIQDGKETAPIDHPADRVDASADGGDLLQAVEESAIIAPAADHTTVEADKDDPIPRDVKIDSAHASADAELSFEEDRMDIPRVASSAAPPDDNYQIQTDTNATAVLEDDGGEITYEENDPWGMSTSHDPDHQDGKGPAEYDSFEGDVPEPPFEGASAGEDSWNESAAERNYERMNQEYYETAGMEDGDTGHTSNEDLESDFEDPPESLKRDKQSDDKSQTVPDISVTYKNEEYPLFHGQNNIETQMGFFEDLGILDANMDTLLSSFREELGDDLSDRDELVFQVDELGLEYSESMHRDNLSGVTLRQLCDIFDQLVKNQYPDESRTLYTYLNIRPNVTKRFEFLVDEAFGGKGLGDVSVRFQAQGSAQEGHQSADGEDEAEYEEGDDAGTYEDGSDNHEGGPPSQDLEETEGSAENMPMEDEVASPEFEEPDAATEDVLPDDDGALEGDDIFETNGTAHMAARHIETNNEEHVDAPFHTQPGELDVNEAGILLSKNEVQEATNTATETNASNSNEQNTTQDELAQEQGDAGLEFLDLIEDEAIEPGADVDDKVNSIESRTTTLNGEDEINYEDDEAAGINMGNTSNVQPELQTGDELDWATYTGPGDDINGLGKRPRPKDDELGLEAEKDVKRRRSG